MQVTYSHICFLRPRIHVPFSLKFQIEAMI